MSKMALNPFCDEPLHILITQESGEKSESDFFFHNAPFPLVQISRVTQGLFLREKGRVILLEGKEKFETRF